MTTTQTDHLIKVRSILAEQLGVNRSTIEAGTTLDELGADSLDKVEIMMALEEEFGVDIAAEDSEKWEAEGGTVQMILDYLENNQALTREASGAASGSHSETD